MLVFPHAVFEAHPLLNHGRHVAEASACPQLFVLVQESLFIRDGTRTH